MSERRSPSSIDMLIASRALTRPLASFFSFASAGLSPCPSQRAIRRRPSSSGTSMKTEKSRRSRTGRVDLRRSCLRIPRDTPCGLDRRAGPLRRPSSIGRTAKRLVRHHHTKRVGLTMSGSARSSRQLRTHADFPRRTRSNTLRRLQLPGPIPGTSIRRPARW